MSHDATCAHAEQTTLLWIYGEGPDDHDLHVADCPACTAVLEAHEEMLAAVAPVAPALAAPVPAPRPQPVVAPPRRARWAPAVAGVAVALAAAALLFVRVGGGEPVSTPVDTDARVAVLSEELAEPALRVPLDSDLDLGLDALDYELDAMSAELGTL